MTKVEIFFKKNYIAIFSFIIPAIIFIIALTINKIYPFGKLFIGAYDASVQYPGFTNYFMEVLKGNASLLYSFKGLLGYNFYATAAYYLFNPTNLLSVFFGSKSIVEYYTFIVILRIALSGFTMSKLLIYKERKGVFTILFSCAYALMAYNVLYFFNFMYFDSIVLLPLVILGIEKLIFERKKALYLVTLTLSILSNFYIGYMICIFSLIYFVYRYILLNKNDKNSKIIKDFVILSIFSGLISSFVLIPTILEIFNGKISVFNSNEFTNYWEFGKDAIDILYRFTIGAFHRKDISYGPPNVFVSMLVISFVILYFFNKNITKKEKIVSGSILALFVISFSFNLFDYAWQMFQRPIWYPNRYSFTFSFFLIILAYKNLCNLEGLKLSNLKGIIILILSSSLIVVSGLINGVFDEKIKILFVILSLLCLTQYIFGIRHKYAYVFCTFLFIIEVLSNSVLSLKNISFSGSKEFYYIQSKSYEKAVSRIKKEEGLNSFYRIEFSNRLNYNNGATFMYNGVNYFSSLRNGKIMTFFEKFGYRVGDGASMVYNFYNPILNSFLGIKYMNGAETEEYYELLDSYGYHTYKNSDALPIAFLIKGNGKNVDFNDDIWENTKKLVNSVLDDELKVYETIDKYELYKAKQAARNNEDYIVEANKEDAKAVLSYNAKEDGFIVFDNLLRTYLNPRIFINDKEIDNYNGSNTMPIFIEKGDKVVIEATYGAYEFPVRYLKAYFILYNDYLKLVDLKKNGINITQYEKDNYIKGDITATEKSVLMTTVPFDKGWKVYVDGVQTSYYEALNSFIALELETGEHTIEFKFFPRGLKSGIFISISSVILSVIYIKKKKEF